MTETGSDGDDGDGDVGGDLNDGSGAWRWWVNGVREGELEEW